MPYKVADQNNGPLTCNMKTFEEATLEWWFYVDDAIARAIAGGNEGEQSLEEIKRDARGFYCVVRTDDDGDVTEELWP